MAMSRSPFSQIISTQVQKHRQSFTEAKRRLRIKNLKYSMLFPARLCVEDDDCTILFEGPEDTITWLERRETNKRETDLIFNIQHAAVSASPPHCDIKGNCTTYLRSCTLPIGPLFQCLLCHRSPLSPPLSWWRDPIFHACSLK